MKSPLDAREERWRRRLALASALPSGCSLVSFTLRMPASLRLGGEYDRKAGRWFDDLRNFLEHEGMHILSYEFSRSADGPEGFCTVRGNGADVKRRTVAFEESHPCGALVDADVMFPDTSVPGRLELELPSRRCMVCGGPALPCVTARAHSAEELRAAAERIAAGERENSQRPNSVSSCPISGMPSHDGSFDTGEPEHPVSPDDLCSSIARCARTAVLYEAAAPKPGLVTPFSNGSHSDMDYFTFLASAAALAPFWERFARLGASFAAKSGFLTGDESAVCGGLGREAAPDPAELLPLLREEGVRAERMMFAATGGVNTHKGLVFSLGVLCAAAGMLGAQKKPLSPEACAGQGALIVRGIVERDFADARTKLPSERTAGERLYLSEGVTGIRGEAERGFPAVLGAGLPHLRRRMAQKFPLNDVLAETLLVLMTEAEDTNLLARGGREGDRLAREAARRALDLGGMGTEEGRNAVRDTDFLLSGRRLSPGGSADLLAVTVFLFLLEEDA